MGIHDGHREKMRQRFMTGGLDAFADHEILELLLYYAIPRRDTNPIAHALMERYGSLPAVLAAPMEDLKRTEGIGESAAVLLHLVPQVCRRGPPGTGGRGPGPQLLRAGGSVPAGVLRWGEPGGHLPAVPGPQGKASGLQAAGRGRVASADLDVRRLVENAILTGASAVILAHNHPSGVAAALRWGLHRHHAGAGGPQCHRH